MFAQDRDLLVLEPNLFRDAAWVGQRLSRGLASIAGNALTFGSPEIDLDDAGVTAGHVVTIGGVSYEVMERLSALAITVSRVRSHADDPILPPSPVSNVEAAIATFAPQIAMVHGQLLRMLGLEPVAPAPPDETNIVNPRDFVQLEALGALHLIFAAASGLSAPGSPLTQKAEWYRQRFAAERQRTGARIDLNNDGVAEAVRRPNAIQLMRE